MAQENQDVQAQPRPGEAEAKAAPERRFPPKVGGERHSAPRSLH